MDTIGKFILKDVRCFEGRHEFNIRPLTFLVGENSTGKSTMLGCFQALNDFMTDFLPADNVDFNKEPYQMGAFADIARKTRSIAKSFELGFEYGKIQYILTLVAREDGSEPIIRQIKNIFEDGELIIKVERIKNGKSLDKKKEFNIKEPEKNKFVLSIKDSSRLNRNPHFPKIDFLLHIIEGESQGKELSSAQKNLIGYLDGKREYARLRNVTYSFAPIRSKPERTYDPLKETESPEGSEVPMVLMNLSKSNEREWQQLKDGLKKFGKASGLFTEIGVRKLGRSTNDPFQLQIKVRGAKGNLMDVGYGVNQILPILVRIILDRREGFLLQQPEVHLHPKGQAELTSLLSDLTKEEKYFIVETHSDAMIDRARIEIMKGILKPEDVSLIYLEPAGNKVKVHNISFDKQANMIDAPDSYREFFLKEGDRLLGFEN